MDLLHYKYLLPPLVHISYYTYTSGSNIILYLSLHQILLQVFYNFNMLTKKVTAILQFSQKIKHVANSLCVNGEKSGHCLFYYVGAQCLVLTY